MSAAVAYLSAIGGMLSYGVASVVQAHAALSATGIDIVKHPAYLTGIALDGLAWVLSLVALASLPLFAVQSMLAGSLAVTMILAAIVLKVPLARRDWWAIGMVTCGLLAVGISSGSESPSPPPAGFRIALGVAAALIIACAAVTYRRRTPIMHAVLGGLGFSGAALAGRALAAEHPRFPALLASPTVWILLALGIAGAVLYARALEVGTVGTATAVLWVIEVVVPGLLGVVLLGDCVRPGFLALALGGVLAAIVGCVVLARSRTQEQIPA